MSTRSGHCLGNSPEPGDLASYESLLHMLKKADKVSKVAVSNALKANTILVLCSVQEQQHYMRLTTSDIQSLSDM